MNFLVSKKICPNVGKNIGKACQVPQFIFQIHITYDTKFSSKLPQK